MDLILSNYSTCVKLDSLKFLLEAMA
jgi:hypothetical protein